MLSGLARAPRWGTFMPEIARFTATSTFFPLMVYCNHNTQHQSIHQSINQLINPSINQSINQIINHKHIYGVWAGIQPSG
jgi:hypothetical protein